MYELKIYRGVIICHDNEEWCKIWRGIENLKHFDFHGLFLSRVYIVWAKKVQRSYLSWHWRVIQNLERNQLVISKLTRGIWHSLTWALGGLKSFPFNGLLLSKVYIVWAKKYRGAILHDIEEWYKIWSGINLSFENWHEEFDKFWPDHLKVSKIFTLMGSFWVYIVWAKKVQRSYLSWHWRGMQNSKRNRLVVYFKIDMRNFDKFWPEHLKVSKKFPFNWLFLSKVYIVWAKRVQRSYLSWHWRVIQNLETTRLVVLKLTWGIWHIFTRALESVKIGTLMAWNSTSNKTFYTFLTKSFFLRY